MKTMQPVDLAELIDDTNEKMTQETNRIVAQMVEQYEQVTKLSREFARLCAVDPETLTGDACCDHAYLIECRREELRQAINALAEQPQASARWVNPFEQLYGAEGPFKRRYQNWREEQDEEEARQQRAAAYRQKLARDAELHERRLRGELV